MITKLLSMILVCLMVSMSCANLTFAGNLGDDDIAKKTAKVKKAVNKLGTGRDSEVVVKLRDKTKIKGYVSQISDDEFTVIDKNQKATVVKYSEVKSVSGKNLPAGAWIAIGVAAGLGVFAIAVLYAIKQN